VPLDAYEEAQFHRITAQLREEDPSLGRTGRWHRAWHGLGPVGAGLLLVAALATLPLALVSNLYPLGLLGYVAATFAGVRLGAIYLPRVRKRSAEGAASPETEVDEPAVNRTGMLWGALVGAAALAAVVALAPGSATDRGAITDPAPDAPAASSIETGQDADEAAPFGRRSIERSAPADGS
jgi:hypothetical protein